MKLVLLMLLCVSLSLTSRGQQSSSGAMKVDRIEVIGNEVTKEEIILREFTFTPGQSLDSLEIEAIRLRITNLNLFNRVEVYPIHKEDVTTLVIAVSEKIYVYPLPYATWVGPSANDFEYGFRYNQLNINGLNQSLGCTAWGGIKQGVQILYWNPWIVGTKGYGMFIVISQETWSENVADREGKWRRERYTGLVGMMKKFTPHNTLRAFVGFQHVKISREISLSAKPYDNTFLSHVEFFVDHRDLIELPHRGHIITHWVDMSRFCGPWENRYGFGLDMRKYCAPNARWTIGTMMAAVTIAGFDPPYLQLRFGESIPVRGINNLSVPGRFLTKIGTDVRYEVFPTRYWTWTSAPGWIAKKTKNLKYGASISGFYELGQPWQRGSKITDKDLYAGYGVAVTYAIPYVNVLRFDCGFNSIDHTIPNFKIEMRAGL